MCGHRTPKPWRSGGSEMSPVIIRTAQDSDIARLAMMMRVSFSDTYGEAWQADDLPAVLSMPGTGARLALGDKDKPLGFYLWRQTLDEAELLLIAVRPEVRGTGLGRRLMQDMMGQARLQGVAQLFLEVREGNTSAQALYRSQGFELVGRRARYYRGRDGRAHDALTLRHDLVGCHQAHAR
jgi:[ribosomal protein S18]-alanine N-acetyltransferase